MLTLRTEIDIDAPAPRVWDVLTDFDAFPRWNPFIRQIDGLLAPRMRLRVKIQPPGGRAMTFHPTVLRVDDGRRFVWRGRTLIPGLFDGEHFFELEPFATDRVRLVHGEHFRGVLVPLLAGTLRTTTRDGFERMNAALKARAEHG
ncbi:MAG: SRPBCC domain-containing protein [Candidatus Rokubacteria bacterium]|nr:SRPBCC domain-containing protein [Candidatus Rokubacteria bacterium]